MVINDLFDAGLSRYHIAKYNPTEQSIAEILEGINPSFLPKISLHSHYHLVLAYGVGGIHYEEAVRLQLGDDFTPKVTLYQSFGIQVSTTVTQSGEPLPKLDYVLSSSTASLLAGITSFSLSEDVLMQSPFVALSEKVWKIPHALDLILSALKPPS